MPLLCQLWGCRACQTAATETPCLSLSADMDCKLLKQAPGLRLRPLDLATPCKLTSAARSLEVRSCAREVMDWM